MKILLTTDWWTPAVNGVVRSVTLLRRELLALGHDVKVLTLSPDSHSYERDGVIYLGSLSADRVYPGARVRFAAWNRWMRALTDWRPDVIHSQCEFSTFLPAWQLARRCSYIPQRSGISVALLALEVVLVGFNPRLGRLERPTPPRS